MHSTHHAKTQFVNPLPKHYWHMPRNAASDRRHSPRCHEASREYYYTVIKETVLLSSSRACTFALEGGSSLACIMHVLLEALSLSCVRFLGATAVSIQTSYSPPPVLGQPRSLSVFAPGFAPEPVLGCLSGREKPALEGAVDLMLVKVGCMFCRAGFIDHVWCLRLEGFVSCCYCYIPVNAISSLARAFETHHHVC
jgi:hypothetical protein